MNVFTAISLFLFLALAPWSCPSAAEVAAQDAKDKAHVGEVSAVDLSFLRAPYAACKLSKPFSPNLAPNAYCLIPVLSGRCSEADDCLFQCIARGNDSKIGGGCWHACFDTKFDLSKWSEPPGMHVCKRSQSAQ
jgi:hypothetical protein